MEGIISIVALFLTIKNYSILMPIDDGIIVLCRKICAHNLLIFKAILPGGSQQEQSKPLSFSQACMIATTPNGGMWQMPTHFREGKY